MSRMVGGFSNLRTIYRLFTGRNASKAHTDSAKSSASSASSRTYNKKKRPGVSQSGTAKDGKMFAQDEGTYVEFEEVKAP